MNLHSTKSHPTAVCRSIMSVPPAVLSATDSISAALAAIVTHRVPALPVVDADDHYLGMMPRSRLMALALPRVLLHDKEKYPLSHLLDAGFIQDSLADLQGRLDAVAGDPIARHLDTEVPVMTPDSSLMSAMLCLHRHWTQLPVVENGKLVGVVSVWDVLARIGRIA